MIGLDEYNRSFERFIEVIEEDADTKLLQKKQQHARDFIQNITQRQLEWDNTFRGLLTLAEQGDDPPTSKPETRQVLPEIHASPSQKGTKNDQNDMEFDESLFSNASCIKEVTKSQSASQQPRQILSEISTNPTQKNPEKEQNGTNFNDPLFSNAPCIEEFTRREEVLHQTRQAVSEINSNPAYRNFKNDINLFIRTQINSISNSDSNHLANKVRLLKSLFRGQQVNYQDRIISTSNDPQGGLFALDLAAQTFVNVGTRLVNSVPAIATSMATVINCLIEDLPIFKDLIIGHLQERCPYLVPHQPNPVDFLRNGTLDEVKLRVACGYSFDSKTQTLETSDKYMARMRSMVLIYTCIIVQAHKSEAWTWLAAFLSLKPQPVITSTILQAFLQEGSKKMSATYGRQYRKLLNFIRHTYIKMIEDVTTKNVDRQSLIKLKNLLSDL